MWSDRAPFEQPADILALLRPALTPTLAEEIVAEAQSEAAKVRLRNTTDTAIQQGVFGVYVGVLRNKRSRRRLRSTSSRIRALVIDAGHRPTMMVDDALFWGFDALPALEAYLNGRDPTDPAGRHAAAIRAWDNLKSSAQRKPGLGPSRA